MTAYALFLSPDAPPPSGFGMKPLRFIASERGESFASVRNRFLASAKGTECFNYEVGKEITAPLDPEAQKLARYLRSLGFRGGLYIPITDWFPGLHEPPEELSAMEAIANAYKAYVEIVDSDAWVSLRADQITIKPTDTPEQAAAKNRFAPQAWEYYQRAILLHRQRTRLMWRRDGQPLPIRWWFGADNLSDEELPDWWLKKMATLFKTLMGAGDSVVACMGWSDARGRIPWSHADQTLCELLR